MLKACMCLCGQDTLLTHGGRRDWGPFCKNGVTASHVLEMRLPQEVPEKQRGLRETQMAHQDVSPPVSHLLLQPRGQASSGLHPHHPLQ